MIPALVLAALVADPLALAAARDRDAVVQLLHDPDPVRRAGAALGLGRLDRPSDFRLLAAPLADADPRVRASAASALGLIALSWEPVEAPVRAEITGMLAGAAPHETDATVRAALAWSLGRAGGPGAASALASLLGDADGEVRARAAYAAGVMARKGSLPDDRATLAGALRALTTDPSAAVRAATAYALANLADPAAAPSLEARLAEHDAVVRAFAARALGSGGEPSMLEKAAREDPAPTVRVEAVRALQKIAGGKDKRAAAASEALVRVARALAAEERDHPGAAASGPLELMVRPGKELRPGSKPVVSAARAALTELGTPKTADQARLSCLSAAAAAGADPARALAVSSCGGGLAPASTGERLEAVALAQVPASRAVPLLAKLSASPRAPAVRAAALDSLSHMKSAAARTAVRAAIAATDGAVAGSAADAAAALGDRAARAPLAAALTRFGGAEGSDAALSIVAALGALGPDAASDAALVASLSDPRPALRTAARAALTRIRPPGSPLPAGSPPAPAAVPDVDRGPERKVRVHTDRGSFTIELLDAEAPVAAGNFRGLARRHFFDGLTFHRVEPGFVIQGGDPRGDGSGGPGYAIPCENASTPYDRGTVGMALSGKDTGGSQWFVTLEPTPHLEGRYTAFGRVVDGMDVVESTLAGDVMRKVELLP